MGAFVRAQPVFGQHNVQGAFLLLRSVPLGQKDYSESKRMSARLRVTAPVLRKVAATMLPFYRRILRSKAFAERWGKAVANADLKRLERMFQCVSPTARTVYHIGTNGIGYFVSLPFPKPIHAYGQGITIPPGAARFFFESCVHRAIVRSVFPFYHSLASNRTFARAVAKGVRCSDATSIRRLVRSRVRTIALYSIVIEDAGIAMSFRYPFSKYTYRLALFQDIPSR